MHPSTPLFYQQNPLFPTFFFQSWIQENLKMKRTQFLFSSFLVMAMFSCVLSAAPALDQCNSEVSKVGQCLAFATGKANTPSKECCDVVKDIKDTKPVCLCIVIQQVHQGQSTLKQLGVQEAKLLQLPGACKLPDASASNCPKLLGLAPGSPDSAIFTNSSSTATSSSTTGTPSTPSSAKDEKSIGFVYGPLASPSLILVAIFIYLFMF